MKEIAQLYFPKCIEENNTTNLAVNDLLFFAVFLSVAFDSKIVTWEIKLVICKFIALCALIRLYYRS